jgi:hypothetical protein
MYDPSDLRSLDRKEREEMRKYGRVLSRMPLKGLLSDKSVGAYALTKFDPFDRITARDDQDIRVAGYWPETAGSPGKDWAAYTTEDQSGELSFAAAKMEASKMFLSKRSVQPYKKVSVGGFEYAVENRGIPEDYEIALAYRYYWIRWPLFDRC